MKEERRSLKGDVLVALLLITIAMNVGLIGNAVSAEPLSLWPLGGPAFSPLNLSEMAIAQRADSSVILDSRSTAQYAKGHVTGAASLPLGDRHSRLEELVRTIPASQFIITYCDPGCDSADRLAAWLAAQGWKHVRVFRGGYAAWRDAGYSVSQGMRR